MEGQKKRMEGDLTRHLAFIDRLLADKDKLSAKCVQLSKDTKVDPSPTHVMLSIQDSNEALQKVLLVFLSLCCVSLWLNHESCMLDRCSFTDTFITFVTLFPLSHSYRSIIHTTSAFLITCITPNLLSHMTMVHSTVVSNLCQIPGWKIHIKSDRQAAAALVKEAK